MSNEQKELFNSWLALRSYARESIAEYTKDKERVERETKEFSDKWDSIKDEEGGWNTLLALTEQRRNNLVASEVGSELPFPELALQTEEIIKAISDFISGIRPVVVGPHEDNISSPTEEAGEPDEEIS